MKKELCRYAIIKEKLPREMVLLQGTGCFWKKCVFCDYFLDSDKNSDLNFKIIDKITGRFGVLDVINSGSAMEFDEKTLNYLCEKIKKEKINTVWFEAHWCYKDVLKDFKRKIPAEYVKFRTGIESFNFKRRLEWNKGILNVSPEEIAEKFDGVCLLVGVKGQNKKEIKENIKIADKYFEYFSVNIFQENSTEVKQDKELVAWFKNEIYPELKENLKAEILLSNTDLGVG